MKKSLFLSLMMTCIVSITFAQSRFVSKPFSKFFQMPSGINESDYISKTVILKVKETHRNELGKNYINIQSLDEYLDFIGSKNLRRKFPMAQKPEKATNALGQAYADLTRTYEFEYTGHQNLVEVINTIYALGYVEYAEPHYIHKSYYNPNDPQISQQSHLNQIRAKQAWDTQMGDATVTIGICDTGIDIDHPDLVNQVQYNNNDPIDGADNDGDGYIDNYRGWDVGEEDNNPQESANPHGCHVSGCAAAETDNGTGIASSGFNCKLLPVKISNANGDLIAGYEGIVYAADHGADIINCSWGSAAGGATGQETITYATINKDALVVAAAGNDNNDVEGFPAAYQYVISVAAVDGGDSKASYSSYGHWVDVSTPGTIYATLDGGGYGFNSGTSMASPVTAGAAAILKSNFPFFSALQIGEQLKVTCDNIDAQNSGYLGEMGHGRINMEASLQGINSPSVVMENRVVTDNNDLAFIVGDTLDISGDYTNYLAPTGNCTATISSNSAFVNILNTSVTLGTIAMNSSVDNNSNPYRVVMLPGIPINERVSFEIEITDGTYTTIEYFDVTLNVDYINVDVNEVATSITSKGLIGFNDFSTQEEGLGFRYTLGENLLFDGGLMIGIPGKVMDHVRGDGTTTDTEFGSVVNATRAAIPTVSEIDVSGRFNDAPAGGGKMDISVGHKAYAWNTPGHTKYVMVEYTIVNEGSSTLSSLYTGIFCDWDIQTYSDNKAATDQSRKLGYCYNTNNNGYYAGVQLLSSTPFLHYAVDHLSGGGGGADLSDGYSTDEKYTTLSTNRLSAGQGSTGNDVFSVVSTGPFDIAAGDSVTVAFALIAGDDLNDLQESSDSSYAQLNGAPPASINDVTENHGISIYPNPAGNQVFVNIENGLDKTPGEIVIVDMKGQVVKQISGLNSGLLNLDVSGFSKGVYMVNYKSRLSNQTLPLIITR